MMYFINFSKCNRHSTIDFIKFENLIQNIVLLNELELYFQGFQS